MPTHAIDDIRNLSIVGHAGAGKTSLCEAILHHAGATKRLGSVDDGSSYLDTDDESKDRRQSIDSSVFNVEHDGKLINAFDTPGIPDYCGVAIASLAAVETAVIVIDAHAGIGVNTRRMYNSARDFGLARMVVINKIDADNVNLEEIFNAVRETFGNACQPINLPADGGKKVIDVLSCEQGASDLLDVGEAHTALVDAIVETDDALMEEYMEAGSLPPDRIKPAIAGAVSTGHLIPVLFTAAKGGAGVAEFLDALTTFAPSPALGKQRELVTGQGDDAQTTPIESARDGEFIAQVFKITSDPKSNIKYSFARVFRGIAAADAHLVIDDERKGQRPGHFLKFCGDDHREVDTAAAGDVIALAKLDVYIGSMIREKPGEGTINLPKLPQPMFALAIQPKVRADIEKIGTSLHRFSEEDPCFTYNRDNETNELVMHGLGDQHLTVIRSKMKRYFKLEVDTKPPKIPYHETIAGAVKNVEYTHKKQSGGAGQFARVFIDMEPAQRGEGYEYIDKIFGGSIDQSFRPSVDKGVRQQMKLGVLAGCPVVDVKVSLVDGKTHPVDSKDIAFQIAGRQVFKKAFMQCKPMLLEPLVNIDVTAPNDFVGEITRDLAGKRGQIQGQDMLPGNQVSIRATVPLAEVSTYSSQLKSVTGGQGSYVMEFSHYDQVPPNVQQQIVAAHKPGVEED